MNEPDRFTMMMQCLPGMIRQIVQQTDNYSEGQLYTVPLMMAVLPGISSNDSDKVLATFDVLDAIVKFVPCIDCSSAVQTCTDLTEVILWSFFATYKTCRQILFMTFRLKNKCVYRQ